jgi:PadR family transcriptional regulator AphA
MSRVARLSTTSYAVLGLLCVRPWSAYQLAQQVDRGWRDVWPRAARGIYNEPKKLVAHDLVVRRTERTGRRARTVYEANDAGRAAFRDWLRQPSAQPAVFESEALIRVLFADHASIADLRAAIAAIRGHARSRSEAALDQGAEYLRSGGPFPERLHLLHLVGGFLAEHHAAMLRWADWAEAEVAGWEGAAHASDVPDLDALGAHVMAVLTANVHDDTGVTGRARPPD